MKNLFLIVLIISSVSCSKDPKIINYGKDNCDFCKMTIMDEKFPAQCFSKKGKYYKFDDVHCLIEFIKNGGVWSNEIDRIYFADYVTMGIWIQPDKAFFLKSDLIKSPMGGNFAVFASEAERDEANKQYNGQKLKWDDIKPVR
jgi:copper chaperone NosL